MNKSIEELLAALYQKGALLEELKTLLHEGQSCVTSLDVARLEENQQEIDRAMERMVQLSGSCQKMISTIGDGFGLPSTLTLTPIIGKVGAAEGEALKKAQTMIVEQSRTLKGTLNLNRAVLQDSLKLVEGSLNFFSRILNPIDTYGNAGSMVSRHGGSRLVCKEI